MRLRAETWIAQMNVEAEDTSLVEGQMKEEMAQEGWMMLSQEMVGHLVMRFGRATPQDLTRRTSDSGMRSVWRRP